MSLLVFIYKRFFYFMLFFLVPLYTVGSERQKARGFVGDLITFFNFFLFCFLEYPQIMLG